MLTRLQRRSVEVRTAYYRTLARARARIRSARGYTQRHLSLHPLANSDNAVQDVAAEHKDVYQYVCTLQSNAEAR